MSAPPFERPPFQRAVVPLDGSALAEAALDPVSRLVPRGQGKLYLLRVVEAPEPPEVEVTDERFAAAWTALREVELRARDLPHELESHVLTGEPAQAILRLAEDVSADLIAMSTHGRGGFERLVFGSVAEQVLAATQVPLLLVNPSGAGRLEEGFPRVLVPLDGSRESAQILPLVEEVALRCASTVVLLHVRAPSTAAADAQAASAALGASVEALRAAGVDVHARETSGPPAREILEVARQERASLLALATRGRHAGRGALSRWLLGSVADEVLRAARCPLLTLRVEAERPAGARGLSLGGAAPRS
ncbi:MAG: universal stress protein [Planctomycetota bacterium]